MDLDKCLKKNGDPCQFFCLQYEFFCGNSMACRREDNSSVRRHSGLEIEKNGENNFWDERRTAKFILHIDSRAFL